MTTGGKKRPGYHEIRAKRKMATTLCLAEECGVKLTTFEPAPIPTPVKTFYHLSRIICAVVGTACLVTLFAVPMTLYLDVVVGVVGLANALEAVGQ